MTTSNPSLSVLDVGGEDEIGGGGAGEGGQGGSGAADAHAHAGQPGRSSQRRRLVGFLAAEAKRKRKKEMRRKRTRKSRWRQFSCSS